jgi:hypothetical protein
MSHRTFQFRLHDQPGQADATPVVERLSDTGVWEVQQSDLSTLTVEVTQDWDVERLSAAFSLLLDKDADGSVRQGADAVAHAAMRTRMERSPVARNLSPTMQKRIDVAWTN